MRVRASMRALPRGSAKVTNAVITPKGQEASMRALPRGSAKNLRKHCGIQARLASMRALPRGSAKGVSAAWVGFVLALLQ